jgi:hypothetical protein
MQILELSGYFRTTGQCFRTNFQSFRTVQDKLLVVSNVTLSYGAGKAVASTAAATSNKSITITPAKPSEVDRVQI